MIRCTFTKMQHKIIVYFFQIEREVAMRFLLVAILAVSLTFSAPVQDDHLDRFYNLLRKIRGESEITRYVKVMFLP